MIEWLRESVLGWLAGLGVSALMLVLCVGVVTIVGCEPPSVTDGTWVLVEKCPDGTGIYKKHNDKEKVTFYVTVQRYPSISVVKD